MVIYLAYHTPFFDQTTHTGSSSSIWW
uniref:Uncharacterized protein n=1 Tax=Anopheles arabiensis TaxID=7173 RepID=A0A182IG89_ANOAR